MTTTRRPAIDEVLIALGRPVPITESARHASKHVSPATVKLVIAALRSANLAGRIKEIDGWQSKDDPTWRQLVFVLDSNGRDRAARQATRNAAADALGGAIDSHPQLADELADAITFRA